ncbi:MAG: ABC transporter substrate-binding protein [Natronomonas sp.]
MSSGSSPCRRAFLAGAAGSLAATSGCIGEIRNLAGRDRTTQLSLTIATMPASEDPYAVRIATELADNLQKAGINTLVDPIRPDVLFRDILVNHDFDLYVSRYPSRGDPDELRSMLYSTYAEEAGWQNPFGFSDLTFDDVLDEQRLVDSDERAERIHEIQRQIIREQPFTVVCFPDHIGAVRSDRFEHWFPGGPRGPTDYLRIDRVGSETTLQLLLRNNRITKNRNPIAVEHRDQGNLIGLLYDSVLRQPQGGSEPINWLAEAVEWDEDGTLSTTIQLRETPWHDGETVTADDVVFTYKFLRDTSLGEFDTPVPTPWRRGRVSLVDSVDAPADHRVHIEFTTGNRSVAQRALLLPILPEHIWRERAKAADIAGMEIAGQTTDALVDSNEKAIGSGPLQFAAAEPQESLSLDVFSEHFLYTGDDDGIPERFSNASFERIKFAIMPSHDAAVQTLVDDGADATADGLQARVVPRVIRENDLSLTTRQSDRFYHVGYNCRRSPLVDPNFRRAVARHIDRKTIVSDSLGGYGVPSETPLKGTLVPDELRWGGEATLPFLGSEGTLDASAAREAFQEAGYQYEDEKLIRRGET